MAREQGTTSVGREWLSLFAVGQTACMLSVKFLAADAARDSLGECDYITQLYRDTDGWHCSRMQTAADQLQQSFNLQPGIQQQVDHRLYRAR